MELFTAPFTAALQGLVAAHHGVYPRLPPRDIFFEDLVARAFKTIGVTDISLPSPGRSKEDMTVSGVKLSIKSETGYGTKPNLITITKLSTTEETEWLSTPLIDRILRHLAEYERMLMVRSIWLNPPAFHYQLLDVPIPLLAKIAEVTLIPAVGRGGKPSKSLTAKVTIDNEVAFSVFFDATDKKCAIRGLRVNQCRMLAEWDHPIPEEWQGNWPIRTSLISGKRSKRRADGGHDEPPSSEDQRLDLF